MQTMTTDELETLREGLGLTQAELAERFGIGLRTYSELKNAGGDVPERYRLAAERVALSVAVELGDANLAPPDVRREALALANIIMYGSGNFQSQVNSAMRKPKPRA